MFKKFGFKMKLLDPKLGFGYNDFWQSFNRTKSELTKSLGWFSIIEK